jgi:hypothetical protein
MAYLTPTSFPVPIRKMKRRMPNCVQLPNQRLLNANTRIVHVNDHENQQIQRSTTNLPMMNERDLSMYLLSDEDSDSSLTIYYKRVYNNNSQK